MTTVPNPSSELLDQLIERVLAGANYKNICLDLIRNIGARELLKRRSLKEAVKATKNKLHQVGGAYLKGEMDYPAWLEALRAARQSKNEAEFQKVCADILSRHASTAERLPLLPQFYATILAELPQIHRIIDIACGLNPVALPWMPLPGDVNYVAFDIYQDMVQFLNQFLALAGVKGQAEARDIIRDCPAQPADVAFILKALPCLEQIDKLAGAYLLDTIQARHLVVSFPVHTLGGRQKGMRTTYEAGFRRLIANRGWTIKRIEFATELVFVVTK
jgi:16S rRNA (guanine(1405)-N(7))-methyltransferase